MIHFNPIFRCGHNSTLNPGILLHGIVLNLSSPKYLVLFEKSFSKLSENHKIGSTEFKLWRLNESTNQLIKRGTCTCSTYLHINLYYSLTLTLLGGWLFDSQWYYGPPLYLPPHDLCPLTLVTSY